MNYSKVNNLDISIEYETVFGTTKMAAYANILFFVCLFVTQKMDIFSGLTLYDNNTGCLFVCVAVLRPTQ